MKTLVILVISLIIFSCGKRKHSEYSNHPEQSVTDIVARLDTLSSLEWDFLTAKTNVKVISEKQNNQFKASLRMKKDSAMLVNISFAAIPIIQASLSNDSLKIVNRKDKCFSLKGRSALEQIIDFPLEYFQLQDILIGKPLLFDKSKEHIQVTNNTFYEIKTKRKRNQNTDNQIIITYFLSLKSRELNKVTLESPHDQTTIEIVYVGRHEKIEGLMLPQEINVIIVNPKGKTAINISYNRPDISHEKKINLNIPENYVACP